MPRPRATTSGTSLLRFCDTVRRSRSMAARPGCRLAMLRRFDGGVMRRWILVLALGLCGCGSAVRPNILMVVIDTARADRFPWAGYDRPTAPRLAALAGEGTVYTQAF